MSLRGEEEPRHPEPEGTSGISVPERAVWTRDELRVRPLLLLLAVLPLAKNRPEIVEMARRIKNDLQPSMRAVYDDTGGIGKLYARQDEIGTPFCVTVDHESLEDNAVTVRDRDTWEQERISNDKLKDYLIESLKAR